MSNKITKAMYEGKEIEVMDCTPTWEQILPTMFMCYENFILTKKPTQEQTESLLLIKKQFLDMAKHADAFNEFLAEEKAKIA